MQILWHLLVLNSNTSPISSRITEVFALCIQQATEWPSVSAFLMKDMALPAKVLQQLYNLEAEHQQAAEGSVAWQAATEQRALMLVGTSKAIHACDISVLHMNCITLHAAAF